MTNVRSAMVVFLAASVFANHAAHAETYICPQQVETSQSIKAETANWKSYLDTNANGVQNITGISVYDGSPEEMADLVPDNENDDSKTPAYWTFEKKKARSIWLQCNYRQTFIRLKRELPKDVVKCVYREPDKMECN